MGFPALIPRETFLIVYKTNYYKKSYLRRGYFFDILNTVIAKKWIFIS